MPDRRYVSLLLVTDSRKTAAQFAAMIPADRFAPEFNVCSSPEADYALGEASYDVVIIDDSISVERSGAVACLAAERGTKNLLLLADGEHFGAVSAFAEAHGFMALPSPVDPVLLRQSLGMMASVSQRFHELEEQADALREKMAEMRVVDQAKLILIQRFKMTEKQAHRFIEKNAMDRAEKRSVIAKNIIRTYQN